MAVAILLFAAMYATIGALVGTVFVWCAIERIDPATHRVSWAFRLLILPGVIAFWPMLAFRWHRAMRSRGKP